MKKGIKIVIIISFVLFTFGMSCVVNADMGDKPSINVEIKNVDLEKYDILLLDKNGEEIGGLIFTDRYSTGVEYSYFGTPTEYRIGLEYNGIRKMTDVIYRTQMHQSITIDGITMKILSNDNLSKGLAKTIDLVQKVVITVILELVIALIFKIKKHWKAILIVNIITNLLFNLMLLISTKYFLLLYLALELVVIVVEYIVYLKLMKDEKKSKVLAYTITSNVISGFLMDFLIAYI